MKFLGYSLVWFRPRPHGRGPQMQSPGRGSKRAHLFGGPPAARSLCGKWTAWAWAVPKRSDRKSPKCPTCARLLRRLLARPEKIVLDGSEYRRAIGYELYST